MKTTTSKPEAGTAIVLAISVIATLVVIVGVAAAYTSTIARNVQRSITLESAVAVADGCLENSFAQWRKLCQATNQPLPTTNELANLALPTQAQFPGIPNFTATAADYNPSDSSTVQQCKVVAVDPQEVPMDPGIRPTAGAGQAGNGDNTYNYLATAYVTLPTLRGNVVAKVQRIFQEQQISPWNYAIFYNDPLEIHPGKSFYIDGWVHTNSDLYTGHKTLDFRAKTSFSGEWHSSTATELKTGFMAADKSHDAPDANDGSPTWPMNPEIRPDFDSTHQPFNLDPSTFGPTDPTDPNYNANNTGYHELIEPPDSGYSDPLQGSRYYDQAGVIIEIQDNPDNTKPDIVTVTGDSTVVAMFQKPGVITTNEEIQDNRETNAHIGITTLDLSKLITNDGGSPNGVKWDAGSFNGIVYVYNTSADPKGLGEKRGVRLKNGAFIPDGGLTVASLNPVYIQGDYNTGLNPPSNSGDPTKPQASGYTREPCAVIADAVNILSRSWNDGTSFNKATNTTVNSAIVSGIVPSGTSNGSYSGGAENFPRLLENWDNQTFTYYGSMVELYNSQQAIGLWNYGSPVYNAPVRQWYFDTNFRLKSPPGTLLTYTYSKSRWSLVP